MQSSPLSKYGSWFHLAFLVLGYTAAGWILADYNASWIVWLGTIAVALHLSKAGTAAIAVATTWIVLLVGIGALTWSYPKHFPIGGAKAVAWSLILVWIYALLMVLLLAFANRPIQAIGLTKKQGFYCLVILTWTSLLLGWLVYQLIT
ncbi:hypothetical protein V2H45_06635 [Tumidithrix elongata RA019]|uniref:Uncharacterized protein n=1 Tax=Tumidithrix elongata BACA0141 TaxID=2716417 RepID=A0AAW9PZD7_9CYAN|nr:hypothetical protein [Tumidithrix elongata RA019]